jgi:hypothetical protein
MPRGIPNHPKKTRFEPPATAAENPALVEASDAAVERLSLDDREAELAALTIELKAEREALEAAKAEHQAYVEAFEASLSTRKCMPKTITLEQDFGFMHNGSLRHWQAGKAITHPADIALLFAKKAPIEGFDHE